MFISKLSLKNIFGITEKTLEPGQITIFEGPTGSGKSSALDAIQTGLSNKNIRSRIIHKDATEAELLIELDDSTLINRKKRSEGSDFIKVTKEGEPPVKSPETFLKQLFSGEQFNPIKDFIDKTPREQQKVLLSLCEISWSKQDYIDAFGEIPRDYDPGLHVLENLEAIQSKSGHYYKDREDINREKRQKETLLKDIVDSLPESYDAETWRHVSVSSFGEAISKAQAHNHSIEKAKFEIDNADNKVAVMKANHDSYIAFLKGAFDKRESDIKASYSNSAETVRSEIDQHKAQIERLNKMISDKESILKSFDSEMAHDIAIEKTKTDEKIKNYQESSEIEVKAFMDSIEALKDIASQKPINVEELQAQSEHAESMKSFVREFDRTKVITSEIKELMNKSEALTTKIELARKLPGELLKTANMPVQGVSIVDGQILINGLPIDNLSDGEKVLLSLEIAMRKVGELKVILVDGFEKLDKKNRDSFIEKAKETGLQFFITRVADIDELIVVEL